jgi:hypothetical protein
VLLAATAVTLARGEEKRAEELAIYAYYLLVIGVVIRFFEFSLPENALVRLGVAKMRFLGWMLWFVQSIWGISRRIGSKLRLLKVRITETEILNVHRTAFKKCIVFLCDVSKKVTVFLALVIGMVIRFFELLLSENTLVRLRMVHARFRGWMMGLVQTIWDFYGRIGSKLRLPEVRIPEVKISNVHRAGFKNSVAFLCDISKNVTILLSLAFLILLIYGLMIDWWTAKGYFTNFVLVILGFFTMYFFMKQLAGSLGEK